MSTETRKSATDRQSGNKAGKKAGTGDEYRKDSTPPDDKAAPLSQENRTSHPDKGRDGRRRRGEDKAEPVVEENKQTR